MHIAYRLVSGVARLIAHFNLRGKGKKPKEGDWPGPHFPELALTEDGYQPAGPDSLVKRIHLGERSILWLESSVPSKSAAHPTVQGA